MGRDSQSVCLAPGPDDPGDGRRDVDVLYCRVV